MLLKWAVASYRQGDMELAKEKILQILGEHPGSKAASKAEKFLAIINRKLGT